MITRKPHPFQNYEFDFEEKWLNDMAQKGKLLTGKDAFTYHFSDSENNTRRYRIIPKKKKAFKEDELALFSESNWNYLFESNGKSILYTDDPKAPELFTDEDSYREYNKRTIRTYFISLIIWIIVAVIWGNLLYKNLPGNQVRIDILAERSLAGEVGCLFALAAIVILAVYHGIGLYRSRRRMLGKADVQIGYNYNGRLTISGIVFVLLIFAIIGLYSNNTKIQEKDLYSYSEPSPVLFKDFDPEGWEFASNHLEPIPADADNGVRYEHDIYKTSNLTLIKGYKELVAAYMSVATEDEEDENYPYYCSLTFDFRSEKVAESALLRELGRTVERPGDVDEAKKQAGILAIDVPNVDYAGFYDGRKANDNNVQELFLRKGCRVVMVYYEGDVEVLDKLSLFTDQLQQ